MFSTWFTKKIFPAKKKHESITRVQNMLLQPPKMIEKFYSPTLCQLEKNKHVKKLSSIYEETIAQENDKILLNRLQHEDTPLTTRKFGSTSEKIDDEKCKIMELYEAILEKDIQYTTSMKKMIDSYVGELIFETRYMAEKEQEELVKSVFGHITSIYEMHKEKFQPFIKSFVDDFHQSSNTPISSHITDFAKKMIVLCKNGEFWPHFVHAMYENETRDKRDNFYSHLMVYAEQKYQFSYFFDPISQLMNYSLIMEEILKEVLKNPDASKTCIVHLDVALKAFNNEIIKIKEVANLS